MVTVRALNLSTTSSNNVVERTREFGSMRSLGAGRGTIMQNIILEACMITAIGYLLAVIPALPLSVFIGQFVGELLMEEAFPLSRFVAIFSTLVVHYYRHWHSRFSGARMALSTFEHTGDASVSLGFSFCY